MPTSFEYSQQIFLNSVFAVSPDFISTISLVTFQQSHDLTKLPSIAHLLYNQSYLLNYHIVDIGNLKYNSISC